MKWMLIAFAALGFTAQTSAQTQSTDHGAHHAPAVAAATPTTDGEVRKVDKEQGKLTLKHARIENLDMPGMTMVFKVADPTMLDKVKPGDKVKFAAENANGALTVTAIEVVN